MEPSHLRGPDPDHGRLSNIQGVHSKDFVDVSEKETQLAGLCDSLMETVSRTKKEYRFTVAVSIIFFPIGLILLYGSFKDREALCKDIDYLSHALTGIANYEQSQNHYTSADSLQGKSQELFEQVKKMPILGYNPTATEDELRKELEEYNLSGEITSGSRLEWTNKMLESIGYDLAEYGPDIEDSLKKLH